MPRRSSPGAVEDLADLTHLDVLVVDKRSGQRAAAKRHRRNRHYERQFIRNALARHGVPGPAGEDDRFPADPVAVGTAAGASGG